MSNGVNTNKWLIASLAINLIFIGALLGGLVQSCPS